MNQGADFSDFFCASWQGRSILRATFTSLSEPRAKCGVGCRGTPIIFIWPECPECEGRSSERGILLLLIDRGPTARDTTEISFQPRLLAWYDFFIIYFVYDFFVVYLFIYDLKPRLLCTAQRRAKAHYFWEVGAIVAYTSCICEIY